MVNVNIGAFIHMAHGQIADTSARFIHRENMVQCFQVAEDIVVRKHYAFRITGCPGGINKRGGIAGLYGLTDFL